MQCWGYNNKGQLGDRRKKVNSSLPVNVIGTPGVVWSSSNHSVATIVSRGLAKGVAVGNSTIAATTAANVNDNAVLTVTSGPPIAPTPK